MTSNSRKVWDLAKIVIGIMIIFINFGNALTGDYQPEWYWRLIGLSALLGAPSMIRDSFSSPWLKEAFANLEKDK